MLTVINEVKANEAFFISMYTILFIGFVNSSVMVESYSF